MANGFSRVDALALLEAHGADAKVLVVGHEPSFSQVVYDFTGGRVDFKKGGVAAIKRAARSGELLVLARPKELEALATGLPFSERARIRASATSARGCSEASSTNSSGLCALPPRGPRPSTVIGIVAAKWLASEAPPREAGATGGRAARRRLEHRRHRRLGVHARPAADQLGVEADVVDGRGMRVEHAPRSRRGRRRARRRRARPRRDDVERVAAAHDGGDRGQVRLAVRVVPGRDDLGGRRRARAARCGRGRGRSPSARCGRGGDVHGARGLAAHDDALLVAGELAGLEAQAGVEAREARDVAEVGGPPLLVAHQQQRELGVELRALGEGSQRAEGEHVAALHVHAAAADQLLAVAVQRLVVGVRDDGVDVADQQRLARARPVQAEHEILGVAGARARHALDRRLVRRERRAQRGALVGAVDVAGGRRDRHQRLELARRARAISAAACLIHGSTGAG